jgi:DNA-binding response OmpR family regulator
MTARSQRGDLVKAEEADANYSLPKPTYTRDELRRAVKALLTRREVERV